MKAKKYYDSYPESSSRSLIGLILKVAIPTIIIIVGLTLLVEHDKSTGVKHESKVTITAKKHKVSYTTNSDGDRRSTHSYYVTFKSDSGLFTVKDSKLYRQVTEGDNILMAWSVGKLNIYVLYWKVVGSEN